MRHCLHSYFRPAALWPILLTSGKSQEPVFSEVDPAISRSPYHFRQRLVGVAEGACPTHLRLKGGLSSVRNHDDGGKYKRTVELVDGYVDIDKCCIDVIFILVLEMDLDRLGKDEFKL